MKVAIYPGSFDPITLGHLDIIRRAARCFDKVYVCVLYNCDKKTPMFSPEERLEMIRRSVAEIPNVEAELFSGLLADYAREKKLWDGLHTLADELSGKSGCKFVLSRSEGYPPVTNDAALLAEVRERFPVEETAPTFITEDFSEYQKHAPGGSLCC